MPTTTTTRTCVVVTVDTGVRERKRFVVVSDADLFDGAPEDVQPTPGFTFNISETRRLRERTYGRFSFGARWLRGYGRVDEMYRTLSTWEVMRVQRLPYDRVWGTR